jgi:glycosyltransferase involved in cell wall biosynthesis
MSELISTVEDERPRESTTSERPRPLRIAQVAPLYESVPPKLYGGTERVVSYLTEELVRRGHQVTLFASGDSQTSAKLHAGYPTALRLAGLAQVAANGLGNHMAMLSQVYEHADDFDIIHCHVDYWTFAFSRLVATPSITTLHGRLDLEELVPIFEQFKDRPVISISDAQRKPLAWANWISTIHHGVPREHLHFNPNGGKYLAFLGRIAPEKRPDIAIRVARKAGIPLKIEAKVDDVDREYFKTIIEPMILESPGVEFIGEINELQKSEFLGNALALLFTIDWPEPFGLVMIEAMACGTPVIARPFGSVPEVMRDGVTGFIASEFDDLVAAVKKVDSISRAACREEYERRFAVDVMAEKYERIYREMISIWSKR